ncbi:subtilisin-like protease SBT3 [Andrographis paniculata]|uniref:subtilisin-like protease SBT3 n=1 Tax=Andrographis paniculata TaxID=175694 RepID=UPI0021E9351E|nr:subtilisin-like protease SBT3 [Andrographis paniculata]
MKSLELLFFLPCLCRVFFFIFFIFKDLMSTVAVADQLETYIVHMDISSMPKPFSSHHNWYLSMLASISDDETAAASKHIYTYTNAVTGFSAVLSPSELDGVTRFPGYVSSVKDRPVEIDTTHSYEFLGLDDKGGQIECLDFGYGWDVIVGVVDTGIWPENESFKDDGMREVPSRWKGACESGANFSQSSCNKKLVGARYFNKGLLAKYPNLTISMNSSRDTEGHGTHTSSTAAGSCVDGASFFGYASGTARGVAPKARIAMYKALWDEGSSSSDIVAAIDSAISDGVDVLSLSFGINRVPLYDDPVAISTFSAMEKGIFVATSAGNDGPEDGTLHNGIPWVLNVAAGTMDREFRGILTLGNDVSVVGLSVYIGNYSSVQLPIVYVPDCRDKSSLKAGKHKIAVCLDTDGIWTEQAYYAKNAKLGGAVFITNATDISSPVDASLPYVILDFDEGGKVFDYLQNYPKKPTARFKFRKTALGVKPAPKLASYSSRGPSKSCPVVLKPDVLAPGDLILASWPPNIPVAVVDAPAGNLSNTFNVASGTSMACPHAAGIAALLKEAHPGWSPAAVRSAMMTTAYTTDNAGAPIKDVGSKNAAEAAGPFGIGAGHVDPIKALRPGLVYDATSRDYVNLLCGLKFSVNQIKTIVRTVPIDCSAPSLDLNYPSFVAYFNSNSSVREFARTLTNVGDANSVYAAKLSKMRGLKVSVLPERLVFEEKHEKKSYRLRIQLKKPMKKDYSVVYGSLTWVDLAAKFSVRSPIVATNLVP